MDLFSHSQANGLHSVLVPGRACSILIFKKRFEMANMTSNSTEMSTAIYISWTTMNQFASDLLTR